MKAVLVIRVDEAAVAALGEQGLAEMYAQYGAWASELARRGMLIDGAELHPSPAASTVRVRDGRVAATPGPADPAAQQVAGYFVIECGSMDEAVEAAGRLPAAAHGSVEVRPLVER